MPSTFFGLNTAYLGLLAANASLNTTANNISNVETKGYSRQHTVQEASSALRTYTTYGCVGAGVDVNSIERYRDEFYDFKYWNNQAYIGNHSVKEYYMKQIEDYFRDDDTTQGVNKGFATLFDDFYNSLQGVHTDAPTDEVRRAFIGQAEKITDYFNTMYGNLQNMQQDVNDEIKMCIDRINAIASGIVTINKQINVIEVGGGNANELRDQRATIIDELSQYVDVQTIEYDVIDPNNPDRHTGATRFIVKIGAGQTLLDDQVRYELICNAREDNEKTNQTDADGLYDIVWNTGNRFSLNNSAMNGKLKGLFDLRDGNNAEYFHGEVLKGREVKKDDATADNPEGKYIKVAVQEDYLKDITKCTLPDEGIITVSNREMHYDSFTIQRDDKGEYFYEFHLNNSPDVNEDIDSIDPTNYDGGDVKVGISVNYQGIPYYMEQMTEWVRSFAMSFNDILTQEFNGKDSVDNYGDPATRLFSYNKSGDEKEQNFADDWYTALNGDPDGEFTIKNTDDTYYRLTAGNFSVSNAMMKDPNLFSTHTGNADEVSKYDVVEELIDLKTNADKMKFRGSSSSSFLQAVLSDIALNGQKAKEFTANFENIGRTIETQRMSVSGVDNDEEALSLVKFQNAYNLASKMIQVLTEVYDRLILQTGV